METLLKRSLHTIRLLKENEKAANEPIAVIGMACRFPGGCTTPEKFWNFLKQKGDGVTDIPSERWDIEEFYDPNPGTPGKMYLRQANFLQEDVGKFDARFFKISPLEASEMDPQQRILLELSWEALERAGQNIEQLRESHTGVFVGIIGSDYSRLPRDPTQVNPYRGTGSIPSIASGRISHILGLHGPALSVDTTCSSSLVSVQLACDSLKKKKCDMALVGGVNMMLSPLPMISLCMMNALSEDGRCRPFDATGQGYGRAEGGAIVVLKRLSTAQKDRDPILAVIRSTAVNHDGSSSGLTVPNGNAQRELIRTALADAGISGNEVNYLEAHGTGTSLGDPIEIKAVTESLGKGRSQDNPLIIGSVKGNVGHLEGAAGICGLIKVVLCLQHKEIPPNVNLKTPNPMIALDKIPAYVPLEVTPWQPAVGKARIAGVSSFGFSGTNAHVILSECPESESAGLVAEEKSSLSLLTLSAKNDWAFDKLLNAYQDHLQAHPAIQISDLCYTANVCRSHFAHRAAFIAKNTGQMREQLNELIQGRKNAGIFSGQTNDGETTSKKVAFLFMGSADNLNRELYDRLPYFRQILEQCASLFEPYLNGSILKWLYPEMTEKPLTYPTGIKEACLFSIEYAVSQFLHALGIVPAAVLGQKTAENYAAACAAGILSVETAVPLVLKQYDKLVGDHCQSPQCRFISSESGTAVKKSALINPTYWKQSFNSPLGIEKLIAQLNGYHFLLVMGQTSDILPSGSSRILNIQNSWETFIHSLAELYCAGVNIHWEKLFEWAKPNKILLPTYPFERKRYWSPLKPVAAQLAGTEPVVHLSSKPLDEKAVFSPRNKKQFEYAYNLSLTNLPEIKDTHGIFHVGYYQELLFKAVRRTFNTTSYLVTETNFVNALILSEEETAVHLILEPNNEGEVTFEFYSHVGEQNQWDLHVKGVLELNHTPEISERSLETLEAIKTRCTENASGLVFYHQLQKRGINLGPAVQWVEEIWYTEGEVLAKFRKPSKEENSNTYALLFHPGVFDACAQIFHAALWQDIPADMKFMVVKWADFAYLSGPGEQPMWCHVVLEKTGVPNGFIRGRFDLFDTKGKPIAVAQSNQMKGLRGYNVRELKKIRENAKSQQKGVNTELKEKLRLAAIEQKQAILTAYLQEVTAKVLVIPVADISVTDSLTEMGMDSMTGLMFKTTVEHEIESDILMEDIIQGPSLSELAHKMAGLMPGGEQQDIEPLKETASSDRHNGLWFVRSKNNPTAKSRLFCLPYGGGGASLYRQWQLHLPEDIEVCPIQLPHRENRLKEKPITDINEMIKTLTKVIQPELDRPYAFYGHSMGALIAYRLAYHLSEQSEIKPLHLFVGGFSSPLIYPNPLLKKTLSRLNRLGIEHIPEPEQIHQMSEEQLNEFANALSGFKRLSEKESELRKVLLPIFVGDLQLVQSYQPNQEETFTVPITAFHGEKDEQVTEDEMRAWKDLTSGVFNLQVIPGDHLFLHPDQSQVELLKRIAEKLDTSIRQGEQH